LEPTRASFDRIRRQRDDLPGTTTHLRDRASKQALTLVEIGSNR